MKTKRNIWMHIAGIFAIVALAACGGGGGDGSSSSKESPAELLLTASSSTVQLAALLAPGGGFTSLDIGADVTVTNFLIALEDIEFERDGEDMDDETDDPEFEGPFYVDLLSPSGILAQSLGEITIPAGTYQGIEFDMHKGDDAATPANLVDRSLYLTGIWFDGEFDHAFEIWHDATEEFFITGPNGIVVESGATGSSLVVDFNVDNILAGIDFSTATQDGNGDFLGDFAISPDSTESANRDLADGIKDNIEAAAEFGEDEDGDGDLEDNEDSEEDNGDEDGDGIDDDEDDSDDDGDDGDDA